MNVVEKELVLLRAQHRADIAEMREEAEVSRAQIANLLSETKNALNTNRSLTATTRGVFTLLIAFSIGALLFISYQERLTDERLQESVIRLEQSIGQSPALSAPASAPVIHRVDVDGEQSTTKVARRMTTRDVHVRRFTPKDDN